MQPRETNFSCGRLAINTRIKSDSAIELDLVEVVDDRMMTSLIASVEDEETMFYIGFQDGTVSKVNLSLVFFEVDFSLF